MSMSDVVRAYDCCYGPKAPELQRFRHDPYNAAEPWSVERCHSVPVPPKCECECECECECVRECEWCVSGSAPATCVVEHGALIGKVDGFVPFDCLAPSARYDASPFRDLHWVYIGQMPFDLDIFYVLRIIYEAAPFATVYDLEPHFKVSKKTLVRVYDGSVFARVSHAHDVIQCINKRVLVEGRGVWFARSCEEVGALNTYINGVCPVLKAQHKLGFIHVPYATATCEIAHSR